MKMMQDHYEQLKNACAVHRHKISDIRETIIKEGRSKDVEKRVRWDILWSVSIGDSNSSIWICDNLYSYLDDDHIDTALRNIMKELEN